MRLHKASACHVDMKAHWADNQIIAIITVLLIIKIAIIVRIMLVVGCVERS